MGKNDEQVDVPGLGTGALVVLVAVLVIGILIGMGCAATMGGCGWLN